MGQDFMEVTYDKFTFRVMKGYLYHSGECWVSMIRGGIAQLFRGNKIALFEGARGEWCRRVGRSWIRAWKRAVASKRTYGDCRPGPVCRQ